MHETAQVDTNDSSWWSLAEYNVSEHCIVENIQP